MRVWPWVLALGACGGGEAPRGDVVTNVVFVVVDTLRADHAHSSYARATTPHFDALAADGVLFEHAFSHAPLTLPAHTALFSSRAPRESGVVNNAQVVPLDLPLLAGFLAERGYACQAAVSLGTLWPIDDGPRSLERGFGVFDRGRFDISRADETNATLEGILERVSGQQPFFLFAHYSDPHEPYDSHGVEHKSAELLLDGKPLARLVTSEWTAEQLDLRLTPGDHTLEVRADHRFKLRRLRFEDAPEIEVRFEEGELARPIERARVRIRIPPGQPADCRLSVWVHDVPDPERLAERYRAEAEYVDRAVGELLAQLKRHGLYDSSLIVFTSDHGEALGEHGIVGHVRTLYDELLHVPLVIKPPRGHPQSRNLKTARDVLARHIDVVPTVLELLGLPALEGQRGLSLLHPGERLLAAETHAPEAPYTLYGLRDLHWKLIHRADEGSFELYDLSSDPGELENIYERDGAAHADWQELLRELARLGAAGQLDPSALDPRTRARLQELGYF